MEARRLDQRVLQAHAWEIVQPTPRMMLMAELFRPFITVVQAGVPLLALIAAMAVADMSLFTRAVAILATTVNTLIYTLRLLPLARNWDGSKWWRHQLIVGVAELGLLAVLQAVYIGQFDSVRFFWWALFFLPIYRLAEVAGAPAGLISYEATVAWWIALEALGVRGEPHGWITLAAQAGLLGITTFVPYFIVRLSYLERQAVRFWFPIATHLLDSYNRPEAAEDLLKSVFELGADSLIGARRASLWLLELAGSEPELKERYAYERDPRRYEIADRWVYGRRRGAAAPGKRTLPVEAHTWRACQEVIPLHIRSDTASPADHSQWRHESSSNHSWLVLQLNSSSADVCLGYLHVEMPWRLRSREWEQVLERADLLGFSLAQVLERQRQIAGERSREALVSQQAARNEASCIEGIKETLVGHFGGSVFVGTCDEAKDSLIASHSLSPAEADWFGQYFRTDARTLGAGNGSSGITRNLDCFGATSTYAVCHFATRSTRPDSLDFVGVKTCGRRMHRTDEEVLTEAIRTLSLGLTRLRIRSAVTEDRAIVFKAAHAQERLHKLMEKARCETGADIVLFYEFESGSPVKGPVTAGKALRFPEYVNNGVVIVNDEHPLIRAVRKGDVTWVADTRAVSLANPRGDGCNLHGHPGFATREGIASCVAVPVLMSGGETLGVVFFNFLKPRSFDSEEERQKYCELFRELPREIEEVKLARGFEHLIEERFRVQAWGKFHDEAKQQVVSASDSVNLALRHLKCGSTGEAEAEIRSSRDKLRCAAAAIESVLNDLANYPSGRGLTEVLEEDRKRLEQDGLAVELLFVGVEAIPSNLYSRLYPILREALRNTRHGKASRVGMTAGMVGDDLLIMITDNGSGFTVDPKRFGHGIRLMHEWARKLHAQLSIRSAPGKNTALELLVPMVEQPREEQWAHG